MKSMNTLMEMKDLQLKTEGLGVAGDVVRAEYHPGYFNCMDIVLLS